MSPTVETVDMFCHQYEQTRTEMGGCDTTGLCGKQPEVSALQDLLAYALLSPVPVVSAS